MVADNIIHLSLEAQENLVKVLLNPSEPTEVLKDLMKMENFREVPILSK